MKKRTALLMTGILILSLGGCAENARSLGGKITEMEISADESGMTDESVMADQKVSEEARSEQSKVPASDSSGAESGTESEKKEDADKSGAESGKESDKKEAADKSDSTIRKVYLQDYFGYRLVLDEDWEFASDKEIEEMNRRVEKEAAENDAFAKIVKNGNFYTDMVADNTENGSSITVRLVQVGLADVIGSEEKRNAEFSDALYAEAEAAGLKKIERTADEVTFLGEEVTALGVKGQLKLSDEYTTEMWYRMVMKRRGEYASVIFVSGFTDFGGDNFQEILDMFESLT